LRARNNARAITDRGHSDTTGDATDATDALRNWHATLRNTDLGDADIYVLRRPVPDAKLGTKPDAKLMTGGALQNWETLAAVRFTGTL